VFYALLFAGSPIDLDVGVDGLSDEDAKLLREAAQATIEDRRRHATRGILDRSPERKLARGHANTRRRGDVT
jgi:hypothetical protein